LLQVHVPHRPERGNVAEKIIPGKSKQ
jgi:hypothetical protein